MKKSKHTAAVLTISDKGSRGEREDLSGSLIQKILEEDGYIVIEYRIIPDERSTIASALKAMSDETQVDLIITTGGTGFSSRDITPEATMDVIEKETPGISEAMRVNSLSITPKGMLSRGVSGIRNKTLIINLPGSPKAVKESLEYILEPLRHGLEILLAETSECAE